MSELSIQYSLDEGAKAPTKAHFTDAGWDFYANEDATLYAGGIHSGSAIQYLLNTLKPYRTNKGIYDLGNGLKKPKEFDNRTIIENVIEAFSRLEFSPAPITIVKTGVHFNIPREYVGLFRDRSGMACKNHITCVGGVIDSGYTGEYLVALVNLGKEDYHIKRGDKIIQLVLTDIPVHVTLQQVEELEETERGEKKFGSSG